MGQSSIFPRTLLAAFDALAELGKALEGSVGKLPALADETHAVDTQESNTAEDKEHESI